VESLANKKNLKSLALNSCKLNAALLEALSVSLKESDSLKELYLYSNAISKVEAVFVSKIICDKRKLTCLGLSNNTI